MEIEMKFLIWTLLIAAAIWWWNAKRRRELERREAERRMEAQVRRPREVIDIEPDRDDEE